MEALCGFVSTDRYDLVVLDTPPSRDALRFLDAPLRATRFGSAYFNLFIPSEGGLIRRMATKLVEQVMDVAFGQSTREASSSSYFLARYWVISMPTSLKCSNSFGLRRSDS